MKRGPTPGVYSWRGQTYIGIAAVACAAGVQPHVVSYHLNRHGNLDRLGIGRVNNWPKDGRGARRRAVEMFGREWPSMSDLARYIGRPVTTVKLWLDNEDDDRLFAALMAADARKTAAALKSADMIDRFGKVAA